MGTVPKSVRRKGMSGVRSKKMNVTMQNTGIKKCMKRLLFKKREKYPFEDVGAKKKTVTIMVSVTPAVAASFKM